MNRSRRSALAGPESSKAIYRVSLEVRVDNVAELYTAAKTVLEAENMTAEEIEEVLRPHGEVHRRQTALLEQPSATEATIKYTATDVAG